jgi:hypothetical protein
MNKPQPLQPGDPVEYESSTGGRERGYVVKVDSHSQESVLVRNPARGEVWLQVDAHKVKRI